MSHWIYIVCQLLTVAIGITMADIRCFCNLAHCVQTGYMCKSTGPNAACYSEHLGPRLSLDTSRHGCIERLSTELQPVCSESAEIFAAHNNHDQMNGGGRLPPPTRFPSLSCCQHDMCNYVKLEATFGDQRHINGSQNKGENPDLLPIWS